MSQDQWTAFILILCTLVEILIWWLIARIGRHSHQESCEIHKRLDRIEEALENEGILQTETLPISRKTGA